MKLFSYQAIDTPRIGAVRGDTGVDLNAAYREALREERGPKAADLVDCWLAGDMTRFLSGGDAAMGAAEAALRHVADLLESPDAATELRRRRVVFPLQEIAWLPVVPRPGKIICIGKNYADHAKEMGGTAPPLPEIFTRFPSTLLAHGQPILKPLATDRWDFEAELAVVIGRRGRRIAEADALSHVAGYACFNDVSARDFQMRITQWTAGKNFDASGPFGPCLVSADEIPDPQRLDIRLEIDGAVMQESNTRHMIFTVAYLIAHLSEFLTLEPGDVIATGTPAGVGAGRIPPRFLKPGESVRVVIEGVGELENPVAAETA